LKRQDRQLATDIKPDLSELIAENFGANATYVEGLLSRFRSNPQLVDESWRAYFTELLGEAPVTPLSGSLPSWSLTIKS